MCQVCLLPLGLEAGHAGVTPSRYLTLTGTPVNGDIIMCQVDAVPALSSTTVPIVSTV